MTEEGRDTGREDNVIDSRKVNGARRVGRADIREKNGGKTQHGGGLVPGKKNQIETEGGSKSQAKQSQMKRCPLGRQTRSESKARRGRLQTST